MTNEQPAEVAEADDGKPRGAFFTDRHNREWDATLTLRSAKRVDASDFTELHDGEVSILSPSKELFQDLMVNKPLAVAVVWAIVQPQAKERGIDEDAFIESLDGQAVEAAIEALWDTLVNFTPELKIALSKMRDLRKTIVTRAMTGLDKLGTAATKRLEKEVDKAVAEAEKELRRLGETSGDPSEASVSPPVKDSN